MPNLKTNPNYITTLTGRGQGAIKSIGTVCLQLKFKNIFLPHTFNVVNDDFPIPCGGILGMDFIKANSCILDFNHELDRLF